MELSEFVSLYHQIQTGPSILLLGQNYLTLGGEQDPVWETLVQKDYPDLELPRAVPDYPLLWEKAAKTKTAAENLYAQIETASHGKSGLSAVKAVVNLRWSLLYTSSLVDIPVSARGCTDVPQNERHGNRKYLNKDRRYRVNLCGDRNHLPYDPSSKVFTHRIEDRIRWIRDYLEYQGVLVIDGLDSGNDWLTDENLFEPLTEMRPKSIYWFHAPRHLEEYASDLAAQEILVAEPEGFYEQLQRHMPEFFQESQDESADAEVFSNDLNVSLTLRADGNQTHTIRIPRADISAINGGNLCLLDDSILNEGPPVFSNRAQSFSAFLVQDGLPSWHLFRTPVGQTPFYIRRNLDQELETRVCTALKETGGKRRPVILEGPSNSGKSTMLANLALTVASRRVYPVIYIRGDLLPGAGERLFKFVKNCLCNSEHSEERLSDKTLIVWDGDGLKQSVNDYEALQQRLFSQNVQVVGSVYKASSGDNVITLSQNLQDKEENLLKKTLCSLGGAYADRFEILRQKQRRNPALLQSNSMLFWLEEMFKYEFDAEYRSLENLLVSQFRREKIHAEEQTAQSLNDYVERFFKAQEIRMQEGIASSFQMKLRMLLKEMKEENEALKTDAPADETSRKMQKLQELSRKIYILNENIALASEFGVSLPLSLLLRFLQEDEAGIRVDDEVLEIIRILQNDTLINFEQQNTDWFGEEYYVRFRSSLEAENCICMLCEQRLGSHTELRKKREVEILKRIIRTASTRCEICAVVDLIRQFGPNGHGMLSEQQSETITDYSAYRSYWSEIAEEAILCQEQDPEIVLVYAHLTREYYARLDEQQSPHEKSLFREEVANARSRLEKTLQELEDCGETESSQYARLSVELCANYQQALQESFNEVYYAEIKRRIHQAFLHDHTLREHKLRRDFSSNFMLDILLNAYGVYHRSTEKQDTSEANDELAWILCAIDDMLDLEALVKEPNRDDIIIKIKSVYAQLGTDCQKMVQLQEAIFRENSDIFLYLQARMLWQGDSRESLRPTKSSDPVSMLRADRYLYLLRDIPFLREALPDDLMTQMQDDARKVIALLERSQTEISKTRSARCVAMLLRARWFLKTGNPMLAEKQRVSLSRAEWDQLYRECSQYASLAEGDPQDTFAPAYFLMGIYQWIYGDAQKSREDFDKAKRCTAPDSNARIIDRFILCSEETAIPRSFLVNVRRNIGRNYTASFREEIRPMQKSTDKVLTRFGMPVLGSAMEYLFHGMPFLEEQRPSSEPAIIGFNLIGAQIESPQNGGDRRV